GPRSRRGGRAPSRATGPWAPAGLAPFRRAVGRGAAYSPVVKGRRSSWDPVAGWYDATVGVRGSPYHRKAAIPTVMRLAELRPGERVIDVGCGTGVLAFHVTRAGCEYLGVDASAQMVRLARKRRGQEGRFEQGDARDLVGTTSARP